MQSGTTPEQPHDEGPSPVNPHPAENGGTAQTSQPAQPAQSPQGHRAAQSPAAPRADAGGFGGTEGLPVYEGLVRERGDVVAEAREVAERTEFEMRQVLPFRPGPRPAPVGR